MKPLICPQCGGKITDYKPLDDFAVCGYCETKFVIHAEKPPIAEPVHHQFNSAPANQTLVTAVIGGILVFVVGIIFLLAFAVSKRPAANRPTPNTPVYVIPTVQPTAVFSPTPADNPNLLEFGETGTGSGAFQNADSIAVDAKGRIYVGDHSLRVQQFDERGNFLRLWQIPSETRNYKRARRINKIAVADDERVFIAVGGVILVYTQDSDEAVRTIHNAPDYIVDFALRSDGVLLAVSSNDEIETLTFVNRSKKIIRTVKGFHTDASDAPISPVGTGLAAIRIAVDGAGGIFSVYALGDLGSYQVSMNTDEFRIFRFTPEGKFVDKFAQSKDSVGIAVDGQSRIYVSESSRIEVYSKDGNPVGAVSDLPSINAFALDRRNNVYAVLKNRVVKRAAVEDK